MDDNESMVAALAASIEQEKQAGNDALKAANMPLARECYEKALQRFDEALETLKPPSEYKLHDVVQYEFGFAEVDIVESRFQDHILKDLSTNDVVKVKAGRYEEVIKRYKAEDLKKVPLELFQLRLAVCQNLTLVALKEARGSKREADFVDVVKNANEALTMDGKSYKALLRKGAALVELNEIQAAGQVLKQAMNEAKNKRDPELIQLLQKVMIEQRKAKASGKYKEHVQPSFQQYDDYAKKTGAVADGGTKQYKRIDSDAESDSTNDSERELLSGRWPKGCQPVNDAHSDEMFTQAFGGYPNPPTRSLVDERDADERDADVHDDAMKADTREKEADAMKADRPEYANEDMPADENLVDTPPPAKVEQPEAQPPSWEHAFEAKPSRKDLQAERAGVSDVAGRHRWPQMVRMIVLVVMLVLIVGGSATLWVRGPPKSSNPAAGSATYKFDSGPEEVEL